MNATIETKTPNGCSLHPIVVPSRLRLVDLFCCGGGAGYGYKLAGFDVVGVDNKPQPKYPMAFVLADALEYLATHGDEYDAVHASPPCQGYSHLTPAAHRGNHAKLIPALREMLVALGKPYVIENVAGARHELRNPVMLCGSMFGLRTQRHRYFETNFPVAAPRKCDHSNLPLLVTTASKASRAKRFALGMKPKSVTNAPAAYGIDWMGCAELKEAIPPAYTLHIGRILMQHMHGRKLMPHEHKALTAMEPAEHDGSEVTPLHSSMEDEAIQNMKDRYESVRLHLHEMDIVHSHIAADVRFRMGEELEQHRTHEHRIYRFDTRYKAESRFSWGAPMVGLCLCVQFDDTNGLWWPVISVPAPTDEEN